MSRSSQRPPRCPFQNRGTLNYAIDVSPLNADNGNEATVRLHRFPSQESYFEEQPLWIDDLLGESEMSPRGALRRSASDSVAILDVLSEGFNDIDVQATDGSACKPTEHTHDTEGGSGLEASCVYGPNSPRHKSNLNQSESAMVSALWENAPQFSFQYGASDIRSVAEMNQYNVHGNPPFSAGDFDPERASRRYFL